MKRILSIIAALLLTVTAAWAQPSGNWTDAGNYASEYKSQVDDGWYLDIHIENAAQLARLAYEINNTENLINFIHALTHETIRRFSVKVKCDSMDEWNLEKAVATGDLLTVRFMKNLREPVITSYRVENLKHLMSSVKS